MMCLLKPVSPKIQENVKYEDIVLLVLIFGCSSANMDSALLIYSVKVSYV